MSKKFLSEGVPSFFMKYDTGLPFDQCSLCENSLETQNRYIVEKVFKQNRLLYTSEIVHEYAVCWDCTQSAGQEVSDESRQAIMNLFREHQAHVMMKADFLHEQELYAMKSWVEKCSLTGKEIRLCDEYAVSGIIENGRLVYDYSPMVVSDTFMQKLQGVLSKETKEAFDDLSEQILDGAPSLEDFIFTPTPGLF